MPIKEKNENEMKNLIKYKEKVENLELEIKELKKYKEKYEENKSNKKNINFGVNGDIKIKNLTENNNIINDDSYEGNLYNIENLVKKKIEIKEKKESEGIIENNILITIPKDKLIDYDSTKKLLSNKRKLEYSSKSIYSNNDDNDNNNNVVIKLKKKKEKENINKQKKFY